jgi:hypothetical protein
VRQLRHIYRAWKHKPHHRANNQAYYKAHEPLSHSTSPRYRTRYPRATTTRYCCLVNKWRYNGHFCVFRDGLSAPTLSARAVQPAPPSRRSIGAPPDCRRSRLAKKSQRLRLRGFYVSRPLAPRPGVPTGSGRSSPKLHRRPNLRTTITRKRNPPAASPSCRLQPMRAAADAPPNRRQQV